MFRMMSAALALSALAAPAMAEGDAAAGEKGFNKCKACHMIVTDAGDQIVKGGRTGPNLYNVAGRQAGTYPDFRYGDDLVAAGEAGLVWDEANFVTYTQDPRQFLRDTLDDKSAKSKMSFKLRDEQDAADIWAYIVSVSAGS
ncbi:MAG: c-type cytochrome [Rhodobacteraceae bacterium]|nr:c-type cytochrome [Paracoccaceae bacterium]